MKLKLIINGCESPEDYKLLSTAISNVASLRQTAVLRFNSEKVVFISTPKSLSGSSSTILQDDSSQLWCTIPMDVFKLYNVVSVREQNAITMEYNCEYLQSVFKRYDRAMNQGSGSDMTIKLQAIPETKQEPQKDGSRTPKRNTLCTLRVTFEEIIHTQAVDSTVDHGSSVSTNMLENSKTVMHSFEVPVKMLFRAQDARILEPSIDYSKIQIDKLPPFTSSFGPSFLNFMKRIERYNSVKHVKLSALRKEDEEEGYQDQLRMIVEGAAWDSEIAWNGVLDPVAPSGAVSDMSQRSDLDKIDADRQELLDDEYESMRVEDSEMTGNIAHESDVQLNDISVMVEKAEKESIHLHEVFIQPKDWRVCHRLYIAFEEVILAISHDQSCVLHCSLDRSVFNDDDNDDEMDTKARERGQIVYYMLRSKRL
ncbi:hypothetical protein HG535_0G02310 [Zygotorulaspora mrakii]|uniref:Checkpoint protein n=1 Tax=Zygotorulaspora mrakii TaxID=42260 RepID=A0A7H9B703_ZYGMR|nr:uncharacterized protein HG535_0G02310 [Zygotorulaspora mrakii]QLG74347.1 hypothetical protein HG535_0G02310 [Zygotorulaspora mrakii]